MVYTVLTRRRFLELSVLTAMGLATGCVPVSPSPASLPAQPLTAPPGAAEDLEKFAQNILSGGPPKDGIPPIDTPRFVAAAEIDRLLKPQDAVFVLHYKGEQRVYPQIVLVWHEIVNDEVAGDKLSVTYCPLTGSVVAFKGRAPDGKPLTFGTTGNLVNSNLLMYDRQTDSNWPQILGQAIKGPMKGTVLGEIPLVWTTWKRWKERGVDAPVLSTQTGHLRSYGQDPYGAYGEENRGYYGDPAIIFPVLARSDRFGSKEVVIGVRLGGARLAMPKKVAMEKGVWNLELAGQPLVAVRDASLETVWVFSRRLGDETVELRPGDGGTLLDQRGRAWRRLGPVLEEPGGRQLPAVPFFDVMWFAWYAFFPNTGVVA